MRKSLYRKKFLYPFLSKMYKLIDENPQSFIYKKINVGRGKNKVIGFCDFEEIVVDPYHTDCNPVSVTIHESLHWFYPEWKEKRVLREEKRIMQNLSRCQLKRIYRKIYKLL